MTRGKSLVNISNANKEMEMGTVTIYFKQRTEDCARIIRDFFFTVGSYGKKVLTHGALGWMRLVGLL